MTDEELLDNLSIAENPEAAVANFSINLVCPFCKKECVDGEDIFIADEDNIDGLDVESDINKIMIHMSCYAMSKKEEKK